MTDKNGNTLAVGDVVNLPNYERGTIMEIPKNWYSPVTGEEYPQTILRVQACTARGVEEYQLDASAVVKAG